MALSEHEHHQGETLEAYRERVCSKWYDGNVDFSSLDLYRCEDVDKCLMFWLKSYSKFLKRFITVAVWYPDEDDSTLLQHWWHDEFQGCYWLLQNKFPIRLSLEMDITMLVWMTAVNRSQEIWVSQERVLCMHQHCQGGLRGIGRAIFYSSCKLIIHGAYMLNRLICVSGLRPNPQVVDQFFEELVLFTDRDA